MPKKIPSFKSRNIPFDSTYGQIPDMLDLPGVIVEPDVREKISAYFKKMLLREVIRKILYVDQRENE